jgi:MSHA biogenesis protein MshP
MMTNSIKIQGSRVKATRPMLLPCSLRLASLSIQRGFSLVTAIFLLVVIAALGTFAVTLSTTQQQSTALDVLGSRAYQASRAGIDWGAYQVLRNTSCPASTTLATMPGTLAGFTVTVTCTPSPSNPFDEAGTAVNMFQLTSTATQGTAGTPDYVERQMSVTIAWP